LSNAGSTSAFAHVHPVLFAFGDEPPLAANVLEDAIVHHLAIETAQQAVERFIVLKLNGHRFLTSFQHHYRPLRRLRGARMNGMAFSTVG
jgi:hypothetical protein